MSESQNRAHHLFVDAQAFFFAMAFVVKHSVHVTHLCMLTNTTIEFVIEKC